MNSEEFDIFCNNQDKELAEAIARQKKFLSDVEASLLEVAFTLYPQIKKYKKHFAKLLKQEVHEQMLGITELLDYFLYIPAAADIAFDAEKCKVPVFDERISEEEELKNTLKEILAPSESLINELKEVIAFNREQENFMFACHHKILELVYVHFPEMVDFSPNAIRHINFSSYVSATLIKAAFYYLTTEYR